jgi:hypothetical protein
VLVLFDELLGLQEKLIKLGADLTELSPGLFLDHPLFVKHLFVELYFVFVFLVFGFQLSNFLRVELGHFAHEEGGRPYLVQSELEGPNLFSFIFCLQ